MPGPDAVATRLRRLTESALAAVSVEEVVNAFLAAARELLSVDQVHLIEVSQDATVGHGRVVAYEAGGAREDAYVMVLDERPSGTTTVVTTGDVVHVPEALGSPALRSDYVERFGVRSALFVPLAWDGAVRWVTVLARTRCEPFSEADIELARVIANQAAAGLALLEARQRQIDRHDQGAALARAAGALNATLDLQTVLETLTREADLALGGDMAGVYLGDGRHGGRATAGHNTPEGWTGYLMKPGEGVGGQVLLTGRAAITNAYQSDVRLPENPGLRQVQTAVAVPMTWDGALKGALSIGFVRMRRVTASDLRTLEAFADLATLACRNAEAFQRIEAAARMDGLTGLLDHCALQAQLRQAIARARHHDGQLACVLIDLDDFDAINERAGHLHGDDVLCRVADVLRRVCQEEYVLARYGGDQFAVLAPGVAPDGAALLAERLRTSIAEHVAVPAGCAPVRASVGVAPWDAELEAAELLDHALGAARAAKRAGGGRVRVA